MAYVFKQDGINSLIYQKNEQCQHWNTQITGISTAANKLSSTSAFQGEGADKAKQYLADIYPALIELLSAAVTGLDSVVTLYNGEYAQSVDGDMHALIKEAELEDLKKNVNAQLPSYTLLASSVKENLNTISDVVYIPYSGISPFDTALTAYTTAIQTLNDQIKKIEADYQTTALEALNNLITKASALLTEQLQMEDLSKYDPSAVVSSKAFQEAVESYNQLYDDFDANAEKLQLAYDATDELLENLYQERVEEAQRAKLVAQIVCIGISIAVTVATGGAAAPAAAIITGAVTGAISSGVDSYYTQRIGTPACPGKVSGTKVFLDAAKGAAVGAATSAVSVGGAKITGGLTQNLSGLGKVAAKGALDGATKIATGATSRGLGTVLETGSVKEGVKAALDGKAILKDGVSGVTSSVITSGTQSYLDKKLPLSSSDSALTRTGKVAIHGGLPDMLSGAGGRFTGTLATTGDLEKAAGDALDAKEMAIDFSTGAVSDVAADNKIIRKMHKTEKEMAAAKKEVDEAASKKNNTERILKNEEKNGFTGVKTDDIGCPRFKDSNAIVTGEDGKPAVVKIELSTTGKQTSDRRNDNFTTYEALKKQGILTDENSSINKTSGRISVKNPETGKMEPATVHHTGDFDPRDNTATVELVKPKANGCASHAGGRKQADDFYESHSKTKADYDAAHSVEGKSEFNSEEHKAFRKHVHKTAKDTKRFTKPSAPEDPGDSQRSTVFRRNTQVFAFGT